MFIKNENLSNAGEENEDENCNSDSCNGYEEEIYNGINCKKANRMIRTHLTTKVYSFFCFIVH